MKNFIIISTIALFLFTAVSFASAQDLTQIKYPVKELGNCKSEEACKAYCDKPDNMGVCLNFAEKYNLESKEDIEIGRKMLAAGQKGGPGGCQGPAACKAYCDDISHMEECMTFAEKFGLLPANELEEGKKVLQAIKAGATPPKCKSKAECDVYCHDADHMEECISFGLAAGLMSSGEAEEAKKMLEALKKGIKPPKCKGKEECDVYCSQEDHMEECVNFSVAAGFMSQEDAEMFRKTGGRGPGGCKGKEECDAFCKKPENMSECIDFSVKAGMMTQEEAEKIKAGGGPNGEQPGGPQGGPQQAGPGGCKSEQECQNYCSAPEHQQECMNFAPPVLQGGQTQPVPPIYPEGTVPPPPMPGSDNNFQLPEGQIPPPGGMIQVPQIPPPTEPPPPPPSSSVPQILVNIFKLFLADVSNTIAK